MESQLDLKREYRITAVIGAAMMLSVAVYALVVEMISLQHESFGGFAPQPPAQLREIFFGVALLLLFVVRKVRSILLKENGNADQQALVNRLRIATIVTFALCEVPAVLGLVLFFMGGFHKEFYALLAFSLVSMFIYFPKYAQWEAWINREPSPF